MSSFWMSILLSLLLATLVSRRGALAAGEPCSTTETCVILNQAIIAVTDDVNGGEECQQACQQLNREQCLYFTW